MFLLDLIAWLLGLPSVVVVERGGSSTTPPWLVAVAAVVAAVLGAILVHRYTLARERRAELTGALDRLVQGYTAADEALASLLGLIDARDHKKMQAAADKVSVCEIETRGAHKSLILRLRPGHEIESAFTQVAHVYMAAWLALGPAIHAVAQRKWTDEATEAAAEAKTLYEQFGTALAVALDVSRKTVGAVR